MESERSRIQNAKGNKKPVTPGFQLIEGKSKNAKNPADFIARTEIFSNGKQSGELKYYF
jgi:hypothetical protein